MPYRLDCTRQWLKAITVPFENKDALTFGMYIFDDDGFVCPPPISNSFVSAVYLEGVSLPTLQTPQDMFRKASNLFSSTNSLNSKRSCPVDAPSTTRKLSATKRPTKKRSLADVLSRASGSSRVSVNSSSLSTSSVDISGSASGSFKTKELGSKLPKRRARKRSFPKWETPQDLEESTRAVGPSKVPYIQEYSAMSIENDFQTSELLKWFYPTTCPTFQQFPIGQAPQNVLDLGCGLRGTWVIDAATYWRAHGTKVTGFDLIKPKPWSIDSSICNNVRFVQGNFLVRLPFEDSSFDFVRMGYLNLSVPQARWPDVLQEAHRVLRPGGTLEVIDEDMLWPYLKSLPTSPVGLTASRSSAFQEDSDSEETPPQTSRRSGLPLRPDAYEEYDRNVSLSNAIEELFEKMIWHKLGIHPRPHEFIEGYITKVFGKNVTDETDPPSPRVFKVALPPTGFELYEKEIKEDKTVFGSLFTVEWEKKKEDNHPMETVIVSESGPPASLPEAITSKAARQLLGSSVPTRLGDKRDITGLVLYPQKSDVDHSPQYRDKFALMDAAQMETSICRSLHVLLSCKKALMEFICELQGGEEEMTNEDISSALWAYECFRRTRFNLPHTLDELKMKEESTETAGSRLSTGSVDSGYSTSSSQSRRESQRSSVIINLQDPEELTCLRVIHVFNGTKVKETS